MIIATLSFLLFAGTAAFAESPAPVVHLILDEALVLPGTPTGLTVIIRNPGARDALLPSALWIVATNESGQTFTLPAHMVTGGMAAAVPAELRTIPSATSRELRFDPIVFMLGSPWLIDERLTTPGKYQLRAVFVPDVKQDASFDPTTAVVSKEEVLTVALPSNDDAAVWEWMQRTGGGKWGQREWSNHYIEFGVYVMGNHPRSQYALFAAFFQRHKHGEVPPHVEELVQRYPTTAFTDQVKLLLVQIHQQGLSNARLQADMYHAAEESDVARALATGLMQNSRSSLVRATAKDLLDRTPTREQLLKKPETR